MAERIVIIGTGYAGESIAAEAAAAGMQVVGTSRSQKTLAKLRQAGLRGLWFDVLESPAADLAPHLGPDTAVVYSVPTIYRDYDMSGRGLPRHIEPVADVVSVCAERDVERFVYLSSTSVYGDHDGAWIDEDVRPEPTSPYGRMRLDIERWLTERDYGVPVSIARLVGIYGPGRTILEYIEKGHYKLVDGGTKPTNRIHVDDIAQVVLAIIAGRPRSGRVYNVADGHPHTVREVVDFLVEHLDIERPPEISLSEYAKKRGPNVAARWKNQYRCRNDRLTDELGVALRYPDVFAGYRTIFELGGE